VHAPIAVPAAERHTYAAQSGVAQHVAAHAAAPPGSIYWLPVMSFPVRSYPMRGADVAAAHDLATVPVVIAALGVVAPATLFIKQHGAPATHCEKATVAEAVKDHAAQPGNSQHREAHAGTLNSRTASKSVG
jgi:hypothetical protein